MKRILSVSAVVLVVAACSDASPTAPADAPEPTLSVVPGPEIRVTNGHDSGNGSFRDAVEQANDNSSITLITFSSRVTVRLKSTVEFEGTQDLTVSGNQSTIDASHAGGDGFLVTGGGDLSLIGIKVEDSPDDGVLVEVPASATGTIKISLQNVEMADNKGFGFVLNDQEDPSTPELPNGDPLPVNPDGSDASLEVLVVGSRFTGNGFSVRDRDGLRVNEGGEGTLTFTMTSSLAQGNGADGVELDERGDGDVVIDVSTSEFRRNGAFFAADLDDGFDIDEYNDGSLIGEVSNSSASRNFEEGFDFNENDNEDGSDTGNLQIEMTQVTANDNKEEGIDLEEDDDFGNGGNLVATMDGVTTNGNAAGDGGLKIREKEAGNLTVTLTNIQSNENATTGIHLRESAAGNSEVSIDGATSTLNGSHGIDLQESSGGTLTAAVSHTTSSNNQGLGISATAGTVTGSGVTFTGNVGGATGGGATFTFLP